MDYRREFYSGVFILKEIKKLLSENVVEIQLKLRQKHRILHKESSLRPSPFTEKHAWM